MISNEHFSKMKTTQKLDNFKNEDNPKNKRTPKIKINLDDLENKDHPLILYDLKDNINR